MAQSQTSTEDEVIAGRYRVEQLLGRGGMGAVYEVYDLSTGELLALKRLNSEAGPGLGELLEREYCTLARLRHPRIVQVFEFGIDRGSPSYTMELLSGADLSRQAPMEWRKACTALRDAASTLGVLHARQLVHRDLNPRNLWQTLDGRLKLLDFGALTSYGVARELVGSPPGSARRRVAMPWSGSRRGSLLRSRTMTTRSVSQSPRFNPRTVRECFGTCITA